jgi:hypothetical protein
MLDEPIEAVAGKRTSGSTDGDSNHNQHGEAPSVK